MSKKLNFYKGYIYRKNIIYIASSTLELEEDDKAGNTIMLRYMKGKWGRWVINHRIIGHEVIDLPKGRTIFSISHDGYVQVGDKDGLRIEVIDKTNASPNNLRSLRSTTQIDKYIYAVGMSRMIYRRSLNSNEWERFDSNIRVPKSSKEISGLNAIVGTDNSNIYVAGLRGHIWYFDGKTWVHVESGTNLGLYSMAVLPSGKVYVCGSSGLVVAGSKDRWRVIRNDVTDDDFWSAACFKGVIYLSTQAGNIYKICDGAVELVDLDINRDITTYKLHVNDGILLSVGLKDIFIFNGDKWKDITP